MKNDNLMEKGSLWMPEAASDYADRFDFFYDMLYYSSIFLLVFLVGISIYFLFKYRRNEKNNIAAIQFQSLKLEIFLIAIPTFLVAIVFVWSFKAYMFSTIVPQEAIEYKVIGQKWKWLFFDPRTGQQSSELVVPVGQNIKLVMTSKDVVHSFFLPNYRVKRDVIPGRYTTLWFSAEREGNYQVFCAEYCGDNHSGMLSLVRVVSEKEYNEYLAKIEASSNISPVELGKKLYNSLGCSACHSLEDKVGIGPGWKNIFGQNRDITDGSSVIVDENYLYESITEPAKKVVKGFNNVMPSFSYLSQKDIDGLIEYIKTVK